MKNISITEGDLLLYPADGKQAVHRVIAVDPATKLVTTQELNTEGQKTSLPFSMLVAGLTRQAFALYHADAVSI